MGGGGKDFSQVGTLWRGLYSTSDEFSKFSPHKVKQSLHETPHNLLHTRRTMCSLRLHSALSIHPVQAATTTTTTKSHGHIRHHMTCHMTCHMTSHHTTSDSLAVIIFPTVTVCCCSTTNCGCPGNHQGCIQKTCLTWPCLLTAITCTWKTDAELFVANSSSTCA